MILGFLTQIVVQFIGMASGILMAAEAAFGWVPGLGDKIRAAREGFMEFGAGVVAGLATAQEAVMNFGSTADAELDRVKADLDVIAGTHVAPSVRVDVGDSTGLLANIKADLDHVEGTNPTPVITAIDEAHPLISSVLGGLNTIQGTNPKPTITPTDGAPGTIPSIQGGLDGIARTHPRPVVTATDNGSVGAVQGAINSIQGKSVTISVGVVGLQAARSALMAPLRHSGGPIFHDGGLIRMHSGGLRSDERMIIAQAGEFMIQRSAVQALGLQAMRMINSGKLPRARGGDGAAMPVPTMRGIDSVQPIAVSVEVPVNLDGKQIAYSSRKVNLKTDRRNADRR